MDDIISFKSLDNIILYTSKQTIIKGAPVIANLLNLNNIYSDKPKMENNSYLLLNELHHKSIILIFKFINKLAIENENENENETLDKDIIYNDIIEFINTIEYEYFIEANEFSEKICITIPISYWKIAKNKPMSREEDIYNEYQFCNYIIDNSKNVSESVSYNVLHSVFLNNGWDIIKQEVISYYNRYGHENYISDTPKTYNITLRKKMN